MFENSHMPRRFLLVVFRLSFWANQGEIPFGRGDDFRENQFNMVMYIYIYYIIIVIIYIYVYQIYDYV